MSYFVDVCCVTCNKEKYQVALRMFGIVSLFLLGKMTGMIN